MPWEGICSDVWLLTSYSVPSVNHEHQTNVWLLNGERCTRDSNGRQRVRHDQALLMM